MVGNGRKCELLDRGLQNRAADTLVRSLLFLAIRVFVLMVPVWEIGVLDGVHLLPKLNAIVEISFELLTLHMVVNHRLAMLEYIQLGLLRLAGIGKVVPHVSLRADTFTFLHLEARVLVAVQNDYISTVGYRQMESFLPVSGTGTMGSFLQALGTGTMESYMVKPDFDIYFHG